ncbi:unnamed protein product, partial [Amoebophrya sp. A25]
PTRGPKGRLRRAEREAFNTRSEFGMLHQPRTGDERKSHVASLGTVPFDMLHAFKEWQSEQYPEHKAARRNPFVKMHRRYNTSENR